MIAFGVAALAAPVLAQSDGLVGPRPDEQSESGWSIAGWTPDAQPDRAAAPQPRSSATGEDAIPLGVPAEGAYVGAAEIEARESATPLGGEGSESSSMTAGAVRTIGALAIVIGLIVALGWASRRVLGGRTVGRFGARSPSGLVEVLARYPLPPRHALVVLRFGQRVLLVSHGAKGGDLTTICELDDPAEVAGVLELVRESEGRSINARFREAISQADERFESAMARPTAEAEAWRGSEAAAQPVDERGALLADHGEDVSPLRRRLDAMRGGVYA